MISLPRRPCGAAILAAALAGCTTTYDTSKKGPGPPHGGTLVSFGDDKGLVEVVHRPVEPRASEAQAEVSFYVLKPDASPYAPAPTNGVLATGKTSVPLVAEGGGLVTPKGPPIFPDNAMEGTLLLDLEGEKVKVPLGIR